MVVRSLVPLTVVYSFTLSLGAYSLSSAAAQRLISIPLAKYTDARVFGASTCKVYFSCN
jgi:hypothetical protein